jgi:hypothetical protein
MVLTVERGRKASYQKAMADKNDINRSFTPLNLDEISPSRPTNEASSSRKRSKPRGIPKARVHHKLAEDFQSELVEKDMSGRKRMFWFVNHFISPPLALPGPSR